MQRLLLLLCNKRLLCLLPRNLLLPLLSSRGQQSPQRLCVS